MPSKAIIIVGLMFGDENKGGTTDFLTREYAAHTVIRFNGGAQAGHNVVTADGRHHTFSQFGSGTFVPGVRTHLSRFMMVNPLNLMTEEQHLRDLGINDALKRLTVDSEALITTPFQVAMNRLREMARGDGRHGSCGLGIGETMSDRLTYGDLMPRAADLNRPQDLQLKLRFVQQQKASQAEALLTRLPATTNASYEWKVLHDPQAVELCLEHYQHFSEQVAIVDPTYLHQLLSEPGTVIFEGAQGVLLDEWRGFHPYTTWSTTTTANAETLLEEAGYQGEISRIGLVRAYATRHGAGPFITEDPTLADHITEPHNGTNTWQQSFRFGRFDDVAIRYAIEATGGVDYLAVSHLDQLPLIPGPRRCVAYQVEDEKLLAELGETDDQGHLVRIKPGRPTDREYQCRLTQLVQSSRPVYSPNVTEVGLRATYSFLDELEQSLGVSIGTTSSGPTTRDKTLLVHSLASCA